MITPETQPLDIIPPQIPIIGKEGLARKPRKTAGIESLPISEIKPIILIRDRVEQTDMIPFLSWMSDEETAAHLDPLPKIPSWDNPEDIKDAESKLMDYYLNRENGKVDDPKKIQPFVAIDGEGHPTGAVTLRWRGDPFVPVNERIAAAERLIVDPKHRREGIGTALMQQALEEAFTQPHYQGNKTAREMRLWIMTQQRNGEKVPNYGQNLAFFMELGFSFLRSDRGDYSHQSWTDFLKARNMPYENRGDAKWLVLKKEKWEEMQKAQKRRN